MSHLYVHIPFCKSRCIYCDFYSTMRESLIPRYVKALCHEITSRREETIYVGGLAVAASRSPVRTIYIGGGTPSRLTAQQLRTILDCIRDNYDVATDAEVTVEMNPEDVQTEIHGNTRKYTESLGVNRISMGIQTFDDTLLRTLRRRHDSATAIRAVQTLQDAGINNISIDIIYGLPGQTMQTWQHDLDTAFELGVQHLSAYALSYEDGTPLSRLRDEGHVIEAPDELSVAMYEMLCDRAAAAGFEHYEISNFALPGSHSRHNSSYWTGEPYLGFGPGAHSFDGQRTRLANSQDILTYLRIHDSHIHKIFNDEYVNRESLSDYELYDEAVMCGLRTARGVDLEDMRRRFGSEACDYLLRTAEPHLRNGLLCRTPDERLCLTRRALMVSDDGMSDLMAGL